VSALVGLVEVDQVAIGVSAFSALDASARAILGRRHHGPHRLKRVRTIVVLASAWRRRSGLVKQSAHNVVHDDAVVALPTAKRCSLVPTR
jgi:hypothetical protein